MSKSMKPNPNIVYTMDEVDVDYNTTITAQINYLISQGWKNVKYITSPKFLRNVKTCKIIGQRPMTPQEYKQHLKIQEWNRKEDIKALTKLAKKYGFKLTKIIE